MFSKKSTATPLLTQKTTLAGFIRSNTEDIVREWSSFAKTRTPASDGMSALALRDHIVEILAFIADDLESAQTTREQVQKSHGDGPKEDGPGRSAAEIHAVLRLRDGFDIDQMVSEYRALRASVVKLWQAKNQTLGNADIVDLTRFNEAVDQAVTESITQYTKTIEHSRNVFLGILGHDLRNPIGAAMHLADIIVQKGGLEGKHKELAVQIVNSTKRANQIVTDLLDLARTSFGSDLPIVKTPMDMGVLVRQIVDEMKAYYPACSPVLEISGDMDGSWDQSRMGQIFSNLIGNAIQHGIVDAPIQISVKGEAPDMIIAVRNQGPAIPEDKREKIFESLVQGDREDANEMASSHLGLGLYITKKIVIAHGGQIKVTSSDAKGTEFTVTLPRL